MVFDNYVSMSFSVLRVERLGKALTPSYIFHLPPLIRLRRKRGHVIVFRELCSLFFGKFTVDFDKLSFLWLISRIRVLPNVRNFYDSLLSRLPSLGKRRHYRVEESFAHFSWKGVSRYLSYVSNKYILFTPEYFHYTLIQFWIKHNFRK